MQNKCAGRIYSRKALVSKEKPKSYNMKKILSVVAAALMAGSVVGFTSCNKKKTCNCTMTTDVSGAGLTDAIKTQMGYPQTTKTTFETEEDCSSGNTSATSTVSGYTATITNVCE
jgi:hypothetical protein